MPSELFYTINFSIAIIFSIIGLIFSLLFIFIVTTNRQCHTVNNLLHCDLCITAVLFSMLFFVGCVYGLRQDWYSNQPLCTVRAYFLVAVVACSSYSFMLQAISQLFFAVFYTRRFLLTCRTHLILIVLKWFTSLLLSTEPFFVSDGFQLIEEYRICAIKTSVLSVALYYIIIASLLPGSIIAIVYGIILVQIRHSTRRVTPQVNTNKILPRSSLPFRRKPLRVLRNMLVLLSILMCGGIPYLILIIWDLMEHQSVPENFHFICINCLILSATIMMIVLFIKNKFVKDIALGYLFRP